MRPGFAATVPVKSGAVSSVTAELPASCVRSTQWPNLAPDANGNVSFGSTFETVKL